MNHSHSNVPKLHVPSGQSPALEDQVQAVTLKYGPKVTVFVLVPSSE